jgi:metal-responsive CopG/Arc/MetJ family transcriptional regulator
LLDWDREKAMTAKPFISARIPQDLLEQLESRADERGESKTEILVEALKEYLEPKEQKPSAEERLSLEQRLRAFEQWAVSRLASIEKKVEKLEHPKYLPGTLEARSDNSGPKRFMAS